MEVLVGVLGVGVVVFVLGCVVVCGFPPLVSRLGGHPLRCRSALSRPLALKRRGGAPFVLRTFPPPVGESLAMRPPLGFCFCGNDVRGRGNGGVGRMGFRFGWVTASGDW